MVLSLFQPRELRPRELRKLGELSHQAELAGIAWGGWYEGVSPAFDAAVLSRVGTSFLNRVTFRSLSWTGNGRISASPLTTRPTAFGEILHCEHKELLRTAP